MVNDAACDAVYLGSIPSLPSKRQNGGIGSRNGFKIRRLRA